ncbi:hypothetical protein EDD15DRAFT_1136085 [Pisolithus albus]|nr:hypothetical protein EDD15DRAFT_1136085 [Pisolithus albus]
MHLLWVCTVTGAMSSTGVPAITTSAPSDDGNTAATIPEFDPNHDACSVSLSFSNYTLMHPSLSLLPSLPVPLALHASHSFLECGLQKKFQSGFSNLRWRTPSSSPTSCTPEPGLARGLLRRRHGSRAKAKITGFGGSPSNSSTRIQGFWKPVACSLAWRWQIQTVSARMLLATHRAAAADSSKKALSAALPMTRLPRLPGLLLLFHLTPPVTRVAAAVPGLKSSVMSAIRIILPPSSPMTAASSSSLATAFPTLPRSRSGAGTGLPHRTLPSLPLGSSCARGPRFATSS